MKQWDHTQEYFARGRRRSLAPLRFCVRSASAFTFIEILAALFFLAILIPAVLEGITISNRVSVFAERGAIAAELAQNKLEELTLNDAWAGGQSRGDFGGDWPGYRWESTQTNWDMDSMTVLTLDVFFSVQGREESLRFSTLVNPASVNSTSATGGSTSASSQSQTKK